MWRNVVKPIATADVASIGVYQRFRHPTKNMVVHGVHIGMALYNDPAFTDIRMKIYADRNGSPGKLLATSTTVYTKAEVLLVEDHALKFAGFLFEPALTLRANQWYHLVLEPSGYTGNDSTFLAWRHSYPDCQYTMVDVDQDAPHAAKHHLDFSLYGYTLEGSE